MKRFFKIYKKEANARGVEEDQCFFFSKKHISLSRNAKKKGKKTKGLSELVLGRQ